METFWFIVIALVLAVYVVLDGFDFGVGMIYLIVGQTDAERSVALKAIGPVWNGNEVWLIAGGGLLFFAFPKAYAAGFSGFYLALIGVLWLLMFRGLAIELRSHLGNPLWRAFWDVAFCAASLVLAVVFGAALGNLIRGVPLSPDGYFFVPLWTTFSPGPHPGILDWFTVLMGVTTAAILMVHGANFLAMKTSGELQQRVRRGAIAGLWVALPLTVLAMAAIPVVQPVLHKGLGTDPVRVMLSLGAGVSLLSMMWCRWRQRDIGAFFSSAVFILALLGNAAWNLYPNLLIATTSPDYSLTIHNVATSEYGLQVGFIWLCIGIPLVLAYTIYVYRSFWGKIELETDETGY
ncbi:MAG: cytochrome d ubiquinol oxidase subunit II [Nitrospira sp.]|nr:cytochrome d ubiquinol oxidase subunit II [Nitrospira sp.]MCA9455524.1 cytochrome d ubiquinol oxidase subunit II [Nitrospira sp.]MCW5785269.1 cytochrome d ubiquinol oxidase subunit II [Nitrospirales bacterium]